MEESLQLKYGFEFDDLFESIKLKELAEKFYEYFQSGDAIQYKTFADYRDVKGEGYDRLIESKILIESARHLHNFLAEFFGVADPLNALAKQIDYEKIILYVKKDFIQRKVFKNLRESDLPNLNYTELNNKVSLLKTVLFSNQDWAGD